MTSQLPSMIYDIPQAVQKRMHFLEEQDARDRQDSTPHEARLRQIPPETGILLALLAAKAPSGHLIEIGTSAGYSALWLSLAARQRGDKIHTHEIDPQKLKLAQQTFQQAEVEDWVQLISGDPAESISTMSDLAFCFLDTDKEHYPAYYQLVIPNLVAGGMLVADNVLSHAEELDSFVATAKNDSSVDAVVLPVGKGLLLARKVER